MTLITSKIETRSSDFQANADQMGEKLQSLRAAVSKVSLGGGERARKRHIDRGKLLPRERIRCLLDPGAPFLELQQLAAWEL